MTMSTTIARTGKSTLTLPPQPVSPSATQPGRGAAAGHANARMLMALLGEVESLSIFIAVCSSIANVLQTQPPVCPVAIDVLDSYLPPEPVIYHAMTLELIEADADGDIMAAQQLLHARLALAQRLSKAAIRTGGASDLIRDTLADAWQRACGAALGAALALRGPIFDAMPEMHRTRSLRVGDLLRAAQRGEHPCVHPDGGIVIPGWAERRRVRRQSIDLAAQLERPGRVDEVRVVDISQGGLGFSGISDAVRGEQAVIVLAGGRRLAGTVAWTSGDRAGLKLGEPIPLQDPLLRQERDND